MTTGSVLQSIPNAAIQTHSVFEQPWWLEATAPGQWGESVVKRGDEVVGRLPYAVKKRLGVTVLSHPVLTPTLGPWLRSTPGKYVKQLEDEKHLMTELIEQLPPFHVFQQNFSPAVTNWLPFYWAGFQATPRYTYRIPDITDVDRVWDDCAHNVRRHVRKAAKELSLRTDLGVDVLVELNHQIFQRQGLRMAYSAEFMHRLDRACAAHDARTLLFAVDARERVHAAAFLVHDTDVTYLLTSGVDTELRSSGAQSLLVWEAIRHAAARSRSFDFAGSMIESVERFNRGFGARQYPYLFVRRTRPGVKPLLMTRTTVRQVGAAGRRAGRWARERAVRTLDGPRRRSDISRGTATS
jgi:Acetyltransferase (GNAT) domain